MKIKVRKGSIRIGEGVLIIGFNLYYSPHEEGYAECLGLYPPEGILLPEWDPETQPGVEKLNPFASATIRIAPDTPLHKIRERAIRILRDYKMAHEKLNQVQQFADWEYEE